MNITHLVCAVCGQPFRDPEDYWRAPTGEPVHMSCFTPLGETLRPERKETRTMTATADTLPLDWNEWRRQWNHWAAHRNLTRVRSPFAGKNFLADEILGVYRVNGRTVEISELTFPNLSERDERGNLLHYNVRRIGLTFADGATDVVGSFADLERALGLDES